MGDRDQTLPPLRVRPDDVKGFLDSLEGQGRCRSTLLAYASKLDTFLSYVTDGLVRKGTLAQWGESLREQGYSSATINSYLSAANGFVSYLGRRDLQLIGLPNVNHSPRPAITRAEYLAALSFARSAGRERDYLLVKAMAVLGLSASSLESLTVDAVERGFVGQTCIPKPLGRELRSFVTRQGISSGPVFRGRDGTPLGRNSLAAALRALACRAGIQPERLSASAVSSLRKAAFRQIEHDLRPLVAHAYDGLLDAEQATIGWGGDSDC